MVDAANSRRWGPERGVDDAEAHLLAFEVPTRLGAGDRLIDLQRVEVVVAGRLEAHGRAGGRDPEQEHRCEDHPTLLLVLDHAPIGVGEGEGDEEQAGDLEQVGQAVGGGERVGRVGVPEAAAVGAELLDGLLARHRAAGNGLHVALHSGDLGGAVEVLDDPPPHEDDGKHHGERQEHPQGGPGEVHPEVADGDAPAARQAPDQGDGHGEADGGGHEVLHREARHLGEVAHGELTPVVLPVCVGDEAPRGVEGRRGGDPDGIGGVERQPLLHALEQVEEQHRHRAEGQQRVRVDVPALLALGVDPRQAVDEALDGQEHAVTRRGPAAEDQGEVGAEQPRPQGDEPDERGELEPAGDRHQNLSGNTRAATR